MRFEADTTSRESILYYLFFPVEGDIVTLSCNDTRLILSLYHQSEPRFPSDSTYYMNLTSMSLQFLQNQKAHIIYCMNTHFVFPSCEKEVCLILLNVSPVEYFKKLNGYIFNIFHVI